MANFQEQISQIKKLRETYREAEEKNYTSKLQLQQQLKKGDNPQTLSTQFGQIESLFHVTSAQVNEAITFLQATSHRELTKELNGNLPIMMLPVRIETRFVDPPATSVPELWIRIFPDDIHANTHEPLLVKEEIAAGEDYWNTMAGLHRQQASEETEESKKSSWNTLNSLSTDPQRALWIAKSTQPINWALTNSNPPETLDFPIHADTKDQTWTRAPRTQALPDKFVVTLFANNESVHEQAGKVIPDVVYLGPDPFAAKESLKKTGDDIVFQEDIAWLQNFDKAVANGLGIKITLKPAMFSANGTIERITVLGLLHSADPESGRKIVEDLFDNHHYSSRGLGFIPQGTATNNTESDGSGYTRNQVELPKGYFEETAASSDAQSDLGLFASAFGIDRKILKDLNHSDMQDHLNGLMMNRALYASTLTYYFDELMEPAIKDQDAVQIRDFFTNYVTARGPLASLRVGDQPYGILLTSDLTRWDEKKSGKFYLGLSEVLKKLQLVWDDFSSKVARVGIQGDSSDILLKILGLQPGSVSFRQRLGNLPDYSMASPAINQSAFGIGIKNLNQSIVDFLITLGFDPLAKGNFYPLISNMVFYQWTNSINLNKLVLPELLVSETETLPKLPSSGLNYAEYMATKCTLEDLEAVNFGGDKPPRSLLSLLMRHALLTELKHVVVKTYQDNKLPIKTSVFEKSLFNLNKNATDLTSFELLRGDPRKMNSVAFANIKTGFGDHFLSLKGIHPRNVNLGIMKNAMGHLGKLPTKTLEKNLVDFIDLCSYRLDAWQMGLFTRRLEQNRSIQPSGIYLASYGWVENLKPEPKQVQKPESFPEKLRPPGGISPIKLKNNAGFSHVPSLNHATAMGLLLAGYKNHASPSNPQLFAINLSSARTRKAIALFEGIRNGQRLEVLLGYQFERSLHEATMKNPATNLNQYILAFRNKYEVENLSIPQQGAAEAQETVDSYPVVNGLKILKATPDEINTLITNPGHRPKVLAIRDELADTLDACNDLLIAEGAYQMTQGNRDRTAGVLNSALMADIPPEFQVLDTLRSSLLTYTHRVSVHFAIESPALPMVGWPNSPSPRSAFEPGLNKWLAELIGDPGNIICRASAIEEDGTVVQEAIISIGDLTLQPIDLVFLLSEDLSGGATELESRIAFQFRASNPIPSGLTVKIEFAPAAESPLITLASAYPLLRKIKQCLGQCRAGDARDFAHKLNTTSKSAGQTGIDFDDFENRITSSLNQLREMAADFNKLEPGGVLPKDEQNPATIGEFFKNLEGSTDESARFRVIQLSEETLHQIMEFQIKATLFGIQVAFPENLEGLPPSVQEELLSKTYNLWKVVLAKIQLAEEKLTKAGAETGILPKINQFKESAKAVLGEDLLPIPRFRYSNPADLEKTFKEEEQLLSHIQTVNKNSLSINKDSWLQSVGSVRPAIAGLETMCLMSEALGNHPIKISLGQVPYRPKDSWLGFEFPKEYNGKPFNIMEDTVALALFGDQAKQTESLQSVLILDEWTEKIPIEEEITGIAYHYNQPNATAPQAVLLAVEPTNSGKWDWDVLQGVLNDTIKRLKSRAVEPDQIMDHDVLKILLPMTIASFDVKEANVSLDYLLLNDEFLQVANNANLELYTKWKIN